MTCREVQDLGSKIDKLEKAQELRSAFTGPFFGQEKELKHVEESECVESLLNRIRWLGSRNGELHKRISILRKSRNSACRTRAEQDIKIKRLRTELANERQKHAKLRVETAKLYFVAYWLPDRGDTETQQWEYIRQILGIKADTGPEPEPYL